VNWATAIPGHAGALRRNGTGLNHPSQKTPSIVSRTWAGPLQEELSALRREKLELHSQLFEAAQIQRKLSGARELRHGSLQISSDVFAASFISGDFTMFSQSGSKVLAAHGDIAGKGVAAGMWFTNLAGLLQSYGRPDADPASIAAKVNRHLCLLKPVAPFITAFLARIDCRLGAVRYCNAGHFPPIVLRADGRIDLLETGGPLLGAIEEASFTSEELLLQPGETLVIYSDGVLECRNAAEEEFGTERLSAALRAAEQQSAHATLVMLLAALQDFANGRPVCDDISLTVIRRDRGSAKRY
jgi:serine phosphatase RsbU (regulator of sigma subunit)